MFICKETIYNRVLLFVWFLFFTWRSKSLKLFWDQSPWCTAEVSPPLGLYWGNFSQSMARHALQVMKSQSTIFISHCVNVFYAGFLSYIFICLSVSVLKEFHLSWLWSLLCGPRIFEIRKHCNNSFPIILLPCLM